MSGAFYACGEDGNVWTNSSGSWAQITVPVAYSTWYFYCVWAFDSSFIIFGASDRAGNAEILKYDSTTDTWDVLATSPFSTQAHVWSDVIGFSKTSIYFVEYDLNEVDTGGLWRWNGSSLQKVYGPTGWQFYNIYGTSASDIWVWGTDGSNDYMHYYNGITGSIYSTTTVGGGVGGNSIHGIYKAGISSVYFRIWKFYAMPIGDLYLPPDWNQVYTFGTGEISYFSSRGLWVKNSSDVVVVGNTGLNEAWAVQGSDTTWTNINPSPNANKALFAAYGDDSDNVLAVGYSGTILLWNGATWSDQSVSIGSDSFFDVIFIPSFDTITIDIQEGERTQVAVYDGTSFQSPYDSGSSIVHDNVTDSYDVTITKTGDWGLGRISLDVSLGDGYSSITNQDPRPGELDVARDTIITFKINT
jgi:hypothetical protein